ncbi:hypothetical protein D7V94_10185 [Parablautia intestinalis]|jgi:hypothetical protein|uniref:Uncharacterized protein n=1 Tax=Parablautia intestinalis TaxID=2320100 RepID=A0A3A9AUR4_9FIRM|nr:hypothetical protein [Parablautia intestinalis]MCI8614354.1 hypothetical protein [Lachnospiraceae bacterium]MDE7048730.1 hypothetical protein [Lachnospiraceae bacterium]RKI91273.1 hypothetical protein D7V94_10185 [Parablautia intestinalis]
MLRSQIEIHFTEIMRLSQQLKELAEKVKIFSEADLMQSVCGIKVGWNSECADILAGKEGKIIEDINIEAQRLNAAAEEMEEQAKKMYQSEIVNSQLGAFRSY